MFHLKAKRPTEVYQVFPKETVLSGQIYPKSDDEHSNVRSECPFHPALGQNNRVEFHRQSRWRKSTR